MGINLKETDVLFGEQQIAQRMDNLAEEIASDYESLLLVGILTGAYVVTSNLGFSLYKHKLLDVQVGFMGISSYDNDQQSSGEPKITLDLKKPIRGRNVLVVEDIVDTGYSMEKLLGILSVRGAASIEIFSLLSKPERRLVNVPIKYKGFDIPNKYVYGYGIDDGFEDFRTLPFIGYKKDS